MRFVAIIAATVGALAIAGTAHDASAQARRAPAVSLTEAAQTSHTTATPPRRGLRWNDSGRWGLNFNLNQPVGRETRWGDVEGGASPAGGVRVHRVAGDAGPCGSGSGPRAIGRESRQAQIELAFFGTFGLGQDDQVVCPRQLCHQRCHLLVPAVALIAQMHDSVRCGARVSRVRQSAFAASAGRTHCA